MATTAPFVALQPLFINGVRAHNAGDTVPDDNVKRNGWEDSVARATSKAAQEVLGSTEDQDGPTQPPGTPPA
jgi:hypothetical protein